jgi:predicted outer membrane repeat protein
MALFFENDNVQILDSKFIENSVLTAGDGGGIFIDKGNTGLVLRDNLFYKNSVYFGIGGGLFFHSQNGDTLCERLTFVENSAGESGGALAFMTDNFDATIRNCTFMNNSAAASGVLDVLFQLHAFYHNITKLCTCIFCVYCCV